MSKVMATAFIMMAALVQTARAAPAVTGAYLEARTCDVWTGPCFSNSELGVRGNHAVVAWSVDEGAWNGVALDGLSVVAVLEAEGTLHTTAEGSVRSVLYVDEKSSEAQAKALESLARALAPKHLDHVLKIERKAIAHSRQGMVATLTVGDVVKIRTAGFTAADSICCHEEQAYPAVSGATDVVCAKSVENTYQGDGLGGVRWKDPNKRSAMIGRFDSPE